MSSTVAAWPSSPTSVWRPAARVLALLALTPAPIWPLFVVAGWMSAVSGLQRPSIEALTPRLVERDEIPAAAALASVRGSISMIAGPALGGVLLASAGLPATYLVDVASYAVSLICLWMIRAVPPAEGADRPSLKALREGFATRRAGRS